MLEQQFRVLTSFHGVMNCQTFSTMIPFTIVSLFQNMPGSFTGSLTCGDTSRPTSSVWMLLPETCRRIYSLPRSVVIFISIIFVTYEPPRGKTNVVVSEQAQKQAKSLKFRI